MPATGYTPIQLYRTTVAGTAPVAANLTDGELAINTTDVAIFAKNTGGSVKRIMNNPVGLKYPTVDGTSGQSLITDGSGTLSFGSPSNFTNIVYTGTLTGGTGVVNFGGQFYKTATGNIGIGTTTPTGKFTVYQSAPSALGQNIGLQYTDGSRYYSTFINGSSLSDSGSSPNEIWQYFSGYAGLSIGSDEAKPVTIVSNGDAQFRVNSTGAIGFGPALETGSSGQVLQSSGPYSYPIWIDPLQAQALLASPYTVSLGLNAMLADPTGVNNVGIGYNSGAAITTGFSNTLVGSNSGKTITTGYMNTIVGDSAGSSLPTNSIYNVLLGANAGIGLSTGSTSNLFVGTSSGSSLTNSIRNVIIGSYNGISEYNLSGLTDYVVLSKCNGEMTAYWDNANNFVTKVTSSAPVLQINKTMTFELTSDTQLKIKVRGSDGVTRSVSLTLA